MESEVPNAPSLPQDYDEPGHDVERAAGGEVTDNADAGRVAGAIVSDSTFSA